MLDLYIERALNFFYKFIGLIEFSFRTYIRE